jgi:hypothetical protein
MAGLFQDPPEGVTRWVAVVRPIYKPGKEPVRQRPFNMVWKDAPSREEAEAYFESDEGLGELRRMFGADDFIVEVVGDTRDPDTTEAVFGGVREMDEEVEDDGA